MVIVAHADMARANAFASCALRATFGATVGFAAGRPPRLPQNIMLVKNLTLHGFYFGRYIGWTPNDERLSHEPKMRRMMETLQRLTLERKIFPTVSHVYEMETLPQALIDLHSRQVLNKLAIKISGDNHD